MTIDSRFILSLLVKAYAYGEVVDGALDRLDSKPSHPSSRFAAKNPFLIQQREDLVKVLMRFIDVERGNIETTILPNETARKLAKGSQRFRWWIKNGFLEAVLKPGSVDFRVLLSEFSSPV